MQKAADSLRKLQAVSRCSESEIPRTVGKKGEPKRKEGGGGEIQMNTSKARLRIRLRI